MNASNLVKFNDSLKSMGSTFTSYDFGTECRRRGVMEQYIRNGAISRYLTKNCSRSSAMIWNKKMKPKIEHNENKFDVNSMMHAALNLMSKEFTSSDFYIACEEIGISRNILFNGDRGATFLKENTERLGRRTWAVLKTKPCAIVKADNELTEDKCVAFLKARGYKIMKPVSEWVEL